MTRRQSTNKAPLQLNCKVILVTIFLHNLSTKAGDCWQILLMIQSWAALSIEQEMETVAGNGVYNTSTATLRLPTSWSQLCSPLVTRVLTGPTNHKTNAPHSPLPPGIPHTLHRPHCPSRDLHREQRNRNAETRPNAAISTP